MIKGKRYWTKTPGNEPCVAKFDRTVSGMHYFYYRKEGLYPGQVGPEAVEPDFEWPSEATDMRGARYSTGMMYRNPVTGPR